MSFSDQQICASVDCAPRLLNIGDDNSNALGPLPTSRDRRIQICSATVVREKYYLPSFCATQNLSYTFREWRTQN
jgi:hypothetical protein